MSTLPLTASPVAKLPLTASGDAKPLPPVMVIEPSMERLLPSQDNLSFRLNLPSSST